MATKEEKLAAIETKLAEIRGKAAKIGKGVEILATEKGRPGVAAQAAKTTAAIRAGGAFVEPSETFLPSVPLEFFLPDIPGEPPDMTRANGRLGFYETEYKTQMETAARLEQQIEARAPTKKAEEAWWQKIIGAPTREEKTKELWEEVGIEPPEYWEKRAADIGEMGSRMGEYDKLKEEKGMALLREENRLAPMGFIQKRMTSVEREYNIRLNTMAAGINTKLAIMEMESGNFEQARSFIREAVDNYVADLRWEYEQFSEFRDINADAMAELSEEYRDALDKAEEASENAYLETKKEKGDVGDLLLLYPTAGIDIYDSLEEAKIKASKVAAPDLLSIDEAKTLGVAYGTTRTQAIQMGIIPPTAGAPVSITGANYNTRLNQEINAMYAGRYGEEGAREQVIDVLKQEFPDVDVAKDVYRRVPDGYEEQIKEPTRILSQSVLNRLSVKGIPPEVATGIMDNLNAGNDAETIRRGLEAEGGNPDMVDTFIREMQNLGIPIFW